MVQRMLVRVVLLCFVAALVACGSSGSNGDADVAIDAGDVGDGDGPDYGVIGEDGEGGGTFAWPSADFCDENAGTFLCPCDGNEDCFSGFCVPSSQGSNVCSKTCEETCPPGWGCDPVGGGGEPTFICVERGINLCRPCAANADCQKFAKPSDRCVDTGDDTGAFCGTSCVDNSECLPGYECLGVPDIDSGTVSKQCVLQNGECSCSPSAIQEGAATTCSNGQCLGVRACSEDGLTACDAPDPEPEVCDGLDNNCNGATDEDFEDTDDDGTADCVDSDDDQDTILDVDDNCPLVANEDQSDLDGDDVGDLCDPPETPVVTGTDPPGPANNNEPTVFGTGEPGTTVHLFADEDCEDAVGTVEVGEDGSWELTVAVQDDSGTFFHVQAESVFGVLTDCSEDGFFYEEVSQDTAPEILGSEPPSPANENEPTIVGVSEPGASVTLTDSEDCLGDIVGQATADDEGHWAIAIGPVEDDTETALYATSPGACNPVPFIYIEDSTPPEGPVLTGTDPPTPSNSLAPTVLGLTEPLAIVHVYEGIDCTGIELGEGEANEDGEFSAPITATENIDTPLSALAVDQAGNVGACSESPFIYANDTVPPEPPLFTGTSPESPSAAVTTPILLGQAEGNASIAIYGNADCEGEPQVVGQAQASGVFGIGVEAASNAGTTWWGITTDVAGNASGCSPEGITFIHDNLLPDPPELDAFDPEPPSSVKTPTLIGTAEPFAKIRAYSSAACNGLIVGAGDADDTGAFGFPVIVNDNGETTIYATAEDGSGLVSDCSAEGLLYVHDASVPDPPFFVGTDPSSPGNTLAFDVLGQAEPGITVTLHTDQDCLSDPVGEVVVPGSATFSISVSAAPNDSISYWGRATDGAGNLSPCTLEPATYVHDGIVPAAPTLIATTPASPAPTSSPTVIGASEPGVTVTLHSDPGCAGEPIGVGVAEEGNGQFEIDATVAAGGTTFIFAVATDAAGNESACSAPPLEFEFDDTEPEIPEILETNPESPANENDPHIIGTALPTTTVVLYADSECAGPELASADADFDGNFDIVISVLDDTTTEIYAAAVNVAEIWSPCSPQAVIYVEDSQEPLAPVLLTTSPDSPSAVPNPIVVGEAESGALMNFYLDEDCAGAVVGIGGVLGDGTFAVPASVLPNQVTELYATATDQTGNTSACSKPGLPYLHDSIPPATPLITSTSPVSPSETNTTPNVSGLADQGSLVTLYATPDCSGQQLGSQIATGDGFDIAIVVGSNTATDLHASASDPSGNVSACSPGLLYVHDDAVPETPTLVSTDPASPASTTQPTVTATAEPNATVRVFLGPDCTGFMTGLGVANANGIAEFDLLVPDNGVSTLYANATDLGGQTSDCTAEPLLYEHDGLAPLAPVLIETTPASPSSEALPQLVGLGEPNATLEIYAQVGCGGAPVSSGPIGADGTFSVGFDALPNSALAVTARAVDPAGNASVCSGQLTYVHDDVPPAAPLLTLTSPPSPSSFETPLLHGTSEPDTAIEVFGTADCTGPQLGAGEAHEAGTFAAVVSAPQNTLTSLHARAIDQAGNVSACSDGFPYEHDDSQPTVPVILSSDPESPNGASTTPLLIGNGDPDATMRIYTDADCDGQVVAEGASNVTGDFSIQVTVGADTTSLYWVASEDAAGNVSPCSAEGFEYVHDPTPPDPPVLLSANPPSPTNATLSPTVSGSAEAGVTVRLYTQVGCGGAPIGEDVASLGQLFSADITVAPNATTTIVADAVDEAGNVSTCTNQGLDYTHDDIPPDPPQLTGTTPASPSADASPDVDGIAELGSTVRIYGNPICEGSVLGTGVAGPGGVFAINTLVGLDSETTVYAAATDAAGNTSDCSSDFIVYTNDSKGPATPLLIGTDPESPSVTDTTPIVLGITDEVVTVFLYMNGGCTGIPVDETTSAGDGTFSFDAIVPENSVTVFFAQAADAIGNLSSCSEGLPYLHDTEAPSAPIITGTDPDSPGQSATPFVEGVTEDDAIVTLHLTADCTDAAIGTGTSDDDGLFSIEVSTINDNAGITYYAMIEDSAGNVSPCSAGHEYVHDTIPPGEAIITGSIPEPPAVEAEPAILGVAEPEAEVFIYDEADCSGASIGGAIADDEGDFAALTEVKLNQPTELHAQAVDAAGNVGPCGPAFGYLHDTKAPNQPVITHTTPASPSNQSTNPTVHGLAEPGTTIVLFNQINCLLGSAAEGLVAADGNFAVPVPVSANSNNILRALARDGAGNKSPCSGTVGYTHDNIPPVFGGIQTVEIASLTSIVLVWEPATDNFTPEEAMAYEVCVTTECGGCDGANFAATHTVGGGGLEQPISGLDPDTRYYFIVRARDQAGNTSPIAGDGGEIDEAPPAVAFKTKGSKMAIDIAVGESQTCALLSDGGLACWGDAVAPDLASPIDVDLGLAHACAIRQNGALQCWGSNSSGQLGDGTTSESVGATNVQGPADIIDVAIGLSHTCAARANGEVLCWGLNQHGQLGDGGTELSASPVAVVTANGEPLDSALIVEAGWNHSCAGLADGSVYCWGLNTTGQIGSNGGQGSTVAVLVDVPVPVTSLTAGEAHTCALGTDGDVYCWGWNAFGQLATGDNESLAVPWPVGLTTAASLGGGAWHVCATVIDGSARCWGRNEFGQLGTGDQTNSNVVQLVTGLQNAVNIGAGSGHTCAILSDGSVRCWGANLGGELGNGTTADSAVPVLVTAISGEARLTHISRSYEHGCVRVSDGGVRCWGRNDSGQIGNGEVAVEAADPHVLDLSATLDVATGGVQSCALMGNHTVRCWGGNTQGSVGNGSAGPPETAPVNVTGLGSDTVALALGGAHGCALDVAGQVYCWGANDAGQVGNGNFTLSVASATLVDDLEDVVAIAAGGAHTCALQGTGFVFCWGADDADQLGTAGSGDSASPALVPGLVNVRDIAAGDRHTCALLANGQVWCWGANDDGQLGDGSLQGSAAPQQVIGLSSVAQLSAGVTHTCVVRVNGDVRCWGSNADTELGTGGTDPSLVPVEAVAMGGPARMVAAGLSSTCAINPVGRIICWGSNEDGFLGTGEPVDNPVGSGLECLP